MSAMRENGDESRIAPHIALSVPYASASSGSMFPSHSPTSSSALLKQPRKQK